MKDKHTYILGQKYFVAFVGAGLLECFETRYCADMNSVYGEFSCGVKFKKEFSVNNINGVFFNITDHNHVNVGIYFTSDLYIFSSKEKAEELLPKILKMQLDVNHNRADIIQKEYMKLVDSCNSLENNLKFLKDKDFTFNNPFEKTPTT